MRRRRDLVGGSGETSIAMRRAILRSSRRLALGAAGCAAAAGVHSSYAVAEPASAKDLDVDGVGEAFKTSGSSYFLYFLLFFIGFSILLIGFSILFTCF